jgi:hypothetical protein
MCVSHRNAPAGAASHTRLTPRTAPARKLSTCSVLALLAVSHLALPRPALAQDMTPPTLVSASSVNGRQIGICFSEEMDAPSLSIAENYLAEDSGGLKGTLRATPQPDGRGVVLTVDPSVVGEFVVTVGFLFDLAGNLLEPGSPSPAAW